MVALAYVIGWAAGNSISCREPFPPPLDMRIQMASTITQGTKYKLCTMLFMMLYFFGMASSIWWVIDPDADMVPSCWFEMGPRSNRS